MSLLYHEKLSFKANFTIVNVSEIFHFLLIKASGLDDVQQIRRVSNM